MNALKIIIFNFFLLSVSYAQEMQTMNEGHYIDKWHKETTKTFKRASDYIDKTLFDVSNLVNNDSNKTIANILKNKQVAKKNKHADEFFLSTKYLSETNDSFLRITPQTIINTKSKFDNKIVVKIRANIPLNYTKRRYQLFIGNLNNTNLNEFTSDEKSDSKPELGVNYFSPRYYKMNQKYSIGVRGIAPFIRARYSREYFKGKWDTEYVQTFQYFLDDGFEEKTQAFFDTSFANLSLFRLFAERGTEEKSLGMFYSGGLIMFWQPSYKAGITLTQSLYGGTKYLYKKNDNISPSIIKKTASINNYQTTLTFRKSFFRKWLFYEIEPRVNFSIVNDYKANYSLRLSLDIFYGDI
ncbi:MAG: hypothetical protein COB17_08950 [Sulfurimonas sp.]|nr:MAG: hypothetical protein COB17_08950 [Sulfurimonas sp.]